MVFWGDKLNRVTRLAVDYVASSQLISQSLHGNWFIVLTMAALAGAMSIVQSVQQRLPYQISFTKCLTANRSFKSKYHTENIWMEAAMSNSNHSLIATRLLADTGQGLAVYSVLRYDSES